MTTMPAFQFRKSISVFNGTLSLKVLLVSLRVSDPHPFHAVPVPGLDKFADADPGCE